MKKLRSPILYVGGKGRMVSKLLKFIPPHKIYVEVFGDGASLLFAKEPSSVEIYNDIDSAVVNFYRVLRNPKKFKKFYHKVSLTPYSREEFNFCRETWKDCQDDVERAYRWFIMARFSFSGMLGRSWSMAVTATSGKMAQGTCAWINLIHLLPEIHARIMQVQIEHYDFHKLIPIYDTTETFMYLDPPYVHDTRKIQNFYSYEMTDDDHKELVELILKSKSMFMLSGYNHPIYQPLEVAGWRRVDFQTSCDCAGRTRNSKLKGRGSALKYAPRIESIWLSPNTQEAYDLLHFPKSEYEEEKNESA